MSYTPKKAKYTTPPNRIKSKAGHGGIPADRIDQANDVLEATDMDFLPYAEKFLESLKTAIALAKDSNNISDEEKRENLAKPAMEFKANGKIFRYNLITEVAEILLHFIDTLPELNKDAVKVIEAHYTCIEIILNNDMKGDGHKEGYNLLKELDAACKRYFAKHQE